LPDDDDDFLDEEEKKEIKFLISGNFHLGKTFNGFPNEIRKKLITAQEKVFDEFIKIAGEGNYAGVIIAGDLFDSLEGASLYAKKVFEDFRKVIITGASMLVTTGNCDPQEEGDFWTTSITPLSFSFYKSKQYTKLVVPKGNVTVGGIAFDPQNPNKKISDLIPEPATDLSISIFHARIRNSQNFEHSQEYEISESEVENLPTTLAVIGGGHKFSRVGKSGIIAGSPQGSSFFEEDIGDRFFAEAILEAEKNVLIKPIPVKSSVVLEIKKVDITNKTFEEIQALVNSETGDSKIVKFLLYGDAAKELFLKILLFEKEVKNSIVDISQVSLVQISDAESLEDKFFNIMANEISSEKNLEERKDLISSLEVGIDAIKKASENS